MLHSYMTTKNEEQKMTSYLTFHLSPKDLKQAFHIKVLGWIELLHMVLLAPTGATLQHNNILHSGIKLTLDYTLNTLSTIKRNKRIVKWKSIPCSYRFEEVTMLI